MNAIILAAGLGSRLRPLTDDCPKCMVEVLGTPMVERQIRHLIDAGVNDITLISGYKADKLDYLKEKYGIKIIHNDRYDVANNIYSLYLAQEEFGDTFVIEGDIYMRDNCINPNLESSAYFAVNMVYTNEWGLLTDADNTLQGFNIGAGNGYIMSGVSYWTKDDAEIIKKKLNEVVNSGNYKDLFWDNIVIDVFDKLSSIKVVGVDCLFEIDTPEDLAEVERQLRPNA